MRKYLSLAGLLISAMSLSSCAKNGYSCNCTNYTTYPVKTQNYPLSGSTRSVAQDQCYEYNQSWNVNGGSCSLH